MPVAKCLAVLTKMSPSDDAPPQSKPADMGAVNELVKANRTRAVVIMKWATEGKSVVQIQKLLDALPDVSRENAVATYADAAEALFRLNPGKSGFNHAPACRHAAARAFEGNDSSFNLRLANAVVPGHQRHAMEIVKWAADGKSLAEIEALLKTAATPPARSR